MTDERFDTGFIARLSMSTETCEANIVNVNSTDWEIDIPAHVMVMCSQTFQTSAEVIAYYQRYVSSTE